jgi:S1-C subfamily serine protease
MSNLLQQLNSEMSSVVESARRSLVKVSSGHNGAGAGTILHHNGLILTNAHVVRQRAIDVIMPDGRQLPAKIIAHDPELDLAALSVAAENLPTIELGDATSLKPGHLVLAMGHPWGIPGVVCIGSIIDVGLPVEIPRLRYEFIQAGLQLRPGHSGGPLVDIRGRLVGINTMITGPKVGLAIPTYVVKDFLRRNLGSNGTSQEVYI